MSALLSSQSAAKQLSLILLAIAFWLIPFYALAVPAQDTTLQIGGESPFDEDTSLLEVFFVNLAENDGVFLRCGGQTLLIDGGLAAHYPALEQFLRNENGSLHIGSLLNTHEHDDHIMGQLTLLKRGGSAGAFFGALSPQSHHERYVLLFSLLKETDTPYLRLKAGDILELGGGEPNRGATLMSDYDVKREGSALLRVYQCTDSTGDGVTDVNSRSLVLHVTFGERTMLLMADAAAAAQQSFLKTIGADLRADVFKAAHHGITPTVSAFLDLVNPSLGIITNVPRGAAAQARQFQIRKIPTLYSGEGTIHLQTDGRVWYVRRDGSGESPAP